jgi:Ca2+-binding RTX toxin-like protein
MSGPSTSAQLYGGSGGYLRPGNNIFIGGGGVTLMVGGNGNDQFYAGSNRLFSGGNDIMIGGSGANYFDCGPNGNGVILDFNPAKGDTKASNCKFVITSYSNNIFGGLRLPNILGGPGLFPGQNLRNFSTSQANNSRLANTGNATSVVMTHNRVPSSP